MDRIPRYINGVCSNIIILFITTSECDVPEDVPEDVSFHETLGCDCEFRNRTVFYTCIINGYGETDFCECDGTLLHI